MAPGQKVNFNGCLLMQPDKQKLFSRLIAGKPAEYAFWRRRPDICWRYAGGLYNRKCLCFSRLTGFESLLNALACSGIFDLSHETVERLRSRGTDPVKQDHGLFFQPEPFGAPCFPIEKLAFQLPFGFLVQEHGKVLIRFVDPA